MSYLADYHVHCDLSFDSRTPMADMAAAAVAAGLDEVCFTDHVDLFPSGGDERLPYDFAARAPAYAAARQRVGDALRIRRGIELGEPTRDPAYADELLARLGELDFVIASRHQLSARWGCTDLYYCAAHDEDEARRQIEAYLALLLETARWGRFSVLGHATLPLRYMNENNGLHASFDGQEDAMAQLFRTLIERGCGIECNTNRGHTPLPDEKWLRLYRSLGGEIITLGSDAHSPDYVGCCIRARQELLRACGFRYFCTFDRLAPVFHKL